MDGRDEVFLFPTTADNKPDIYATPHVRLRAELPNTALRFRTDSIGGTGSLRDPGSEPMNPPRRIDCYYVPLEE